MYDHQLWRCVECRHLRQYGHGMPATQADEADKLLICEGEPSCSPDDGHGGRIHVRHRFAGVAQPAGEVARRSY